MRARCLLSLAAFALVSFMTADARSGIVPSQFIAKAHTELLGRAPTTGEMHWLESVFEHPSVTCNVTMVHALVSALVTTTEFQTSYPDSTPAGKAARVIALVRAVYNHDPNSSDWALYYGPYNAGTKTWTQTVEAIVTNGIFAYFLLGPVCDPDEATYGYVYQTPMDVYDILNVGASRTQEQIQTLLDTAEPNVPVELEPFEVIRIGGNESDYQPLVIPAGVTLTTAGNPARGAYARMGRLVRAGSVCTESVCDGTSLVVLEPGATLRSVWVDGDEDVDPEDFELEPQDFKVANVETLGSTALAPTTVEDCRISEPGRNGTAIRARGFGTSGEACEGQVIESNLVTSYGSAHASDRLGRALWTDGIAVFCEGATVEDNHLVDVSDTGIMLHGVQHRVEGPATQHSQVTGNRVLNAGNPAHVAIGADPVGECLGVRDGGVIPCLDLFDDRSFEGSEVSANVFFTSRRSHFDVGLLVGGRPLWGDHGVFGSDAVFEDNTSTATTRVNMGVSVLGMFDTTLTGNASSFTLIDPHPAIQNAKCPQENVVIGSSELASVLSGAQAGTETDSGDGCVLPEPPPLEPITVDGEDFVGALSGGHFTPWGMQFIAKDTSTPQNPDEAAHIERYWDSPVGLTTLVHNLREMKRMGANTVRFYLQFVDLMDPPSGCDPESPPEECQDPGPWYPDGTPNEEALEALGNLIDAAEETGLYLILTGLGIEDVSRQQTWYDERDDTGRRAAQQAFWTAVADVAKTSPSVLAYDLMNEPVAAPWPSFVNWCVSIQNNHVMAEQDDRCYTQFLQSSGCFTCAGTIVEGWVQDMRSAIESTGDTDHLVTVGMLPGIFSPFREAIADDVDFLSTHIYPEIGDTSAPPSLGLAIDLADGAKVDGHPLLIEETYIYPNPDTLSESTWLPTLDTMAADVESFILGTTEIAAGWLGGYLGTTPLQQARDTESACLIPTTISYLPCIDPLNDAWLPLFLRNAPLVNVSNPGTVQP